MKAIFINLININSGKYHKLVAQTAALKDVLPDVTTYVLHTDEDDSKKTVPAEIVHYRLPRFRRFEDLFFLPLLITRLCRSIRPDVVVMRSLIATPVVWWAFRKRKFALVTEHHSKRLPEIRSQRGITRFLFLTLEFVFRHLTNRVIDGRIAVTEEIARSESLGKKYEVIPNSIDTERFDTVHFPDYNGKKIRILMACSYDMPWHGVDRLIRWVAHWKAHNPTCAISVDIVGRISIENYKKYDLDNIDFHGFVDKNRIDQLAKTAHIGISTLALYRKNMNEACPLKSREYIARGLPFIYGYRDPDISSDSLFALRVPNDGSLLDFGRLEAFLYTLNRQRSVVERQFAETRKTVSWNSRMRKYSEFLETITDQCDAPRI